MNATPAIFLNDLQYCHFKSNEHVAEGLCGETDLDVLVAETDHAAFTNLLRKNGFIRVVSPHWNSYPGIEDWLGYDPKNQTPLHIHLHTKLLIGKKFVKEVHLPWEKAFLDTRVHDTAYGVMVANPHYELLLLLIRIGTKTTLRQTIQQMISGNGLPHNIVDELEYLLPKTNRPDFTAACTQLVPERFEEYAALYSKLQAHTTLTTKDLRTLRRTVRRTILPHTRTSSLSTTLHFYIRAVAVRVRQQLKRCGFYPVVRKTLPDQGTIVAVLGIDGSGKSTLVPHLAKQFGWKLETASVYLGRHWIFPLLGTLRKKIRKRNVAQPTSSVATPDVPTSLFTNLQHVVNAEYRLRQMTRIAKLRAQGFLVITDRYPQTQHRGKNDSPSIVITTHSSWFQKLLARYEEALYQRMSTQHPDVIIKLLTSPEVASKRKPDHSLDEISAKAHIIEQLEFTSAVTHTINTDTCDIPAVRKSAEQFMWDYLSQTYETTSH